MRGDLDLGEEAHCILLDKTIRDITVAEQLLRNSLVPFQPLDERRTLHREEFAEPLDALRNLLVKHTTHTLKGADGKPIAGPFAHWRDRERALGISESQRKSKVGALRLAPEELERVRSLPQEHAVQISRLPDKKQRADLIQRAPELTHRQVHRVVDRLLADRELDIDGALAGDPATAEPGTFDRRLETIADLCPQLARSLRNPARELTPDQYELVSGLIRGLDRDLADFGLPARAS